MDGLHQRKSLEEDEEMKMVRNSKGHVVKGNLTKGIYRSFTSARLYVRKLGLKNVIEWGEYRKSGEKPDDIPSLPGRTYKKEWNGWGDWLGTGIIATTKREHRSFKEARKFVRKIGLSGKDAWVHYVKKNKLPGNIPRSPPVVYKKEWNGWGDWLGTGRVATQELSKNYLPWSEAKKEYRRLAEKYKITTAKQWREFVSMHASMLRKLNLAKDPWRAYTREQVWRRR